MFTSLRARLWLTYAIIILLILSILGIGIFVYVIRNPLIDRQALGRLDAALAIIQRQINERSILPRDFQQYLNRISESLDIRLILFNSERETLLDSEPDSPAIIWPSDEISPQAKGQIDDQDGKTWLYSSWVMPKRDLLVLILPRQGGLQLLRSPQLRETLREDFLPAFLRAGLVAFLLAVVFAAWMGSWITSPLQDIEQASRNISNGEYQQIPLQGPDEVQALAGAYNEMIDQVRASQQSQRDFVANVSHELKTPLTSIQGFSQAMLDGTVESGPALTKAAGIIKTEADRMYRLVVDLLDLARFDAGTVVLDRQALDLSILLTHVVNQLIPQAAEARVKLSLDVDPLPTCVGDEDRLAQVFTNLVDNAIKHTPENGFVKMIARSDAGLARIEIIDSGKGIPEDHLDRIFERFYKVDGSRKKEAKPGTGLGLAIAQQIVQAHDGTIAVRSTFGEGSVFEVTIPVVKADDQTILMEKMD
ncbi:MAG: HAMP domain-containing protein [Anaerolineales bacterium]|nr:HAMP domain-containing protein [Anaerolineales bacterium]